MGRREKYEPGTFSWVELATTDREGAKAFYSSIFGWQTVDNPVRDGMVYTMCLLDGDPVAALYERVDGSPAWLSYVSVRNADETAARARELGGTSGDPFDVLDVGRMAAVRDPDGAAFAVWEPRSHIGATRVNDPGCFCWNHLFTSDVDRAAAFYSSLFEWRFSDEENYTIKIGERTNGGIAPLPAGLDAPPHWTVWFTVASLDEALGTVERGGGSVRGPRRDVSVGQFAVAEDPQGATFFLFEGQVDD
jgi:uncharacterized protein